MNLEVKKKKRSKWWVFFIGDDGREVEKGV